MNYLMTSIEEKIKSLYHSLGIHTPSKLDLFTISRKLNIPVYIGNWDSKVIKYRGKYRIVLNGHSSRQQQWEDFGHELCHVLNHVGNQLSMSPLFRELQEYQANNFMYHFCVPTFMLLEMEFPSYRNEAIKLVSDTFHVTLPFAQKRLELFENRVTGLRFLEQIAENQTQYNLPPDEPREIDLYEDVPPWEQPGFAEFIKQIPLEERDQFIWDMKSAYYQRELEEMKR